MMRGHLLPVGLLTAGVLLFFWDALTLQGAFFVQDVMVQNYPFRHFFSQALKQLEFPLWHPGINCGFPIFAEGQAGALYPFNLLTSLLLPTWVAISYNVAAHLWLGGIGTYSYLRAVGACPAAATTSGITYALSGYIVVRAMSQNYVDVAGWMPFLFLTLEIALRRRDRRFLLLTALVFALQLLAGHPQAAVYAALAAMLYAVFRAGSTGSHTGGWRDVMAWTASAAAALAAGAGLAAVQLLPTAELVQLSARAGGLGYEEFAKMSLPPERMITLLLPNLFGNSAAGTYWGREEGFFIQLCPYIGVLPLLLAVVGVRGRDPHAMFFFVLAAAALILSLGKYTPLYRLIYELPGLSFFRIPTRFLLWWAFSGAVLAGLGMHRLLSAATGRGELRWWFGAITGAGAIVLLTAIIGSEVLTTTAPQQVAGERYRDGLLVDLARCVLALGTAVAVGLLCRSSSRRRWGAWIIPFGVFAELFHFGYEFNGVVDSDVYLETPRTAEIIMQDSGADTSDRIPALALFRTASFVAERGSSFDWHGGWIHDSSSYREYPETLRMYSASTYGLAGALPGWSPLHLQRHWEFAKGYPALLSLANVRYALSHVPVRTAGLDLIATERVLAGQEVLIYRNSAALPRAYLVGDYATIPDTRRRLAYLRGRRFDPAARVVFSQEPALVQPCKSPSFRGIGVAHLEEYLTNSVVISIAPTQAGFLVLSDTHYPGWRAYVDGEERPVLLANHVFRAVAVVPGDRQVAFRFESDSFRYGVAVSLMFLSLALVLALRATSAARVTHGCEEISTAAGHFGGMAGWTTQALLIVLIYSLVRNLALWAQVWERCSLPTGWI